MHGTNLLYRLYASFGTYHAHSTWFLLLFWQFFFGVIEISSIPLSLLTAYNIRQDWVKEMPTLHLVTKIGFAIAFIGARVILWNMNMLSFLKDTWNLITASSSSSKITNTARVITLIAGDIPAFFLTALQLFWAFKILEAAAGMAVGKKQQNRKLNND